MGGVTRAAAAVGRLKTALIGGSCVLIVLSVYALANPTGTKSLPSAASEPSLAPPSLSSSSASDPAGSAPGQDELGRAPVRARRNAPSPPALALQDLVLYPDLVPPSGSPRAKASTVPLLSENVRFVQNLPLGGATVIGTPGGRFKRVNTPAGERVYMFVSGSINGVTVLDVTDAKHPIVVGEMPLLHWENEDVDLSGNTLLISADGDFGSALFVVDISLPNAPHVKGFYKFAREEGKWEGWGGPGHISNCIQGCEYAWVTGSGGGWVAIVDLGDPSASSSEPTLVGAFRPPAGYPNGAFKTGTVHDVNVDPTGLVWLTGSGGLSVYSVGGPAGGSPVEPRHIASHAASDRNAFILHNSLRPGGGRYVYVTEENWFHPDGDCAAEGRFEVFEFDGSSINPISTWSHQPRVNNLNEGAGPFGYLCSAHWFDYRSDGIIAIGHYQQGARFLDVSNPAGVHEMGWWLPPDAMTSAAYFHPNDTSVVYVVDYQRGLDILQLCDGKCTLPAGPASVPDAGRRVSWAPSAHWRFACPVIVSSQPPDRHSEGLRPRLTRVPL